MFSRCIRWEDEGMQSVDAPAWSLREGGSVDYLAGEGAA